MGCFDAFHVEERRVSIYAIVVGTMIIFSRSSCAVMTVLTIGGMRFGIR